jgi:hypothetical protein
MIGEDDGTVIYATVSSSSGPPIGKAIRASTTIPMFLASDLFRLDPATGERTALLSGIDEGIHEIVSDGKRAAWIENGITIHVWDLISDEGKSFRLTDVCSHNQFATSVLDIDDTSLIVTCRTEYQYSPANEPRPGALVLVDVEAETQEVIYETTDHAALAVLQGNYLTVVDVTPAEAITDWRGRIEVIDLDTEERITLPPDSEEYDIQNLPFIAGNQIVWQELTRTWPEESKVFGYDLVTKERYNIDDSFTQDGERELIDFDGEQLLVLTTTPVLFGLAYSEYKIELQHVDGARQTIAEDVEYGSDARFVSDYVVWPDKSTSEFVIYEQATGQTRRVAAKVTR